MGTNNSLTNGVKKLCESLGRSNKATYAVVAIAAAKGIFRPLFTLSDKHEKPETKRYTAWREGLTEVVAIPTYLGIAMVAEKIATNLKVEKKSDIAVAKHNANFLGVCFAAAIVIPLITSIIINPIMKVITKNDSKKKAVTQKNDLLDLKGEAQPKKAIETSDYGVKKTPYTPYKPLGYSFAPARQLGMKVGGL